MKVGQLWKRHKIYINDEIIEITNILHEVNFKGEDDIIEYKVILNTEWHLKENWHYSCTIDREYKLFNGDLNMVKAIYS